MEAALVVLFAPAALIAASALGLHQVFALWRVFASAVNTRSGSAGWKAVQPGAPKLPARVASARADAYAALKQLNPVFESSLGGSANTIKTSPTHVLLVAVVLAVLISGERVRSALRKR